MLGLMQFLVLFSGILCHGEKYNTAEPNLYHLADEEKSLDDFSGVLAGFDDAEHRGSSWYSFETSDEAYKSELDHGESSDSSDVSVSLSSPSESSEASSQETKERRMLTRTYRQCTPCPQDMMKSYKNIGIKWICGSYQRARRSFKSECMMRHRNCQDGTMFVKLGDHRCRNDSYHGRHWFYVYKT